MLLEDDLLMLATKCSSTHSGSVWPWFFSVVSVLINVSMKSESDHQNYGGFEFTYVFIYISMTLLLMLGDIQREKKIEKI